MNWSKIVPQMTSELNLFVNHKLSAENLYKLAISKNLGKEIRPLIRNGASRGRRVAREALRRREVLQNL